MAGLYNTHTINIAKTKRHRESGAFRYGYGRSVVEDTKSVYQLGVPDFPECVGKIAILRKSP